jgi:hypothetical protein
LWVPEATRQVPRIRGLIDGFREAGAPVIHLGYETSLRSLNFPAPELRVPISDGLADFKDELFQRVSFYGSDVTSSDDEAQHEAELRTLRRGFARIATAEEVLAELRADRGG